MPYRIVKTTFEGVRSVVLTSANMNEICGWMEAHTAGNRRHCKLGLSQWGGIPSYTADSSVTGARFRAEYVPN